MSLPFFKGLLAFIRSARLGHRQAEDQGLGVPKEVAQAVENAAVQILAAMPGYEPREPEPSTEDLRREAGESWARLKGFSIRDRRVLVAGAREYQTWALCEGLCAESERVAPGNAARAVELAELALEVAALVPGEQSWRLRLQGYAWAHVGNARRVANDWPRAEEAFQHARVLWRPWEE